MEISVFWLAFTFGIHIAMVNLGIAFSWMVPLLKRAAEKRGDQGLMRVARTLMRFYAATYGVAGVFGTAFTVFLLSYYPEFIGLAGHLTLIPFGISIMLIILHFFTIVAYWYGWYRWSPGTHFTIGLLMALSATLIPFGFRAVFAFLNTPAGLYFQKADGTIVPRLDVVAALANPTFAPLYLKSIAAALTAGVIVTIAGYLYRYYRPLSGEDRELSLRIVRILLPPAALGLAAMFLLGFWYGMSLIHVPYKFNSIFGGFGWSIGDIKPALSLSWLFVLKMLFVAIQVIAVIYALYSLSLGREFPTKLHANLFAAAGFSALATIVTGEYLNAFSQYPYFVAALADPRVVSTIPEPLRQPLASILSLKNVNELATTGFVTLFTAVFIGALLVAVALFLYILLTPPKKK